MSQQPELTEEKSQEQAAVIFGVAVQLQAFDVFYCREVAKSIFAQANRQESMAVLNASYPQAKNDLLRKQAQALRALCDYVDLLKEVDQLKKEVAKHEQMRGEINRMFL